MTKKRLVDKFAVLLLLASVVAQLLAALQSWPIWLSPVFIVFARWQFLVQHVDAHRPIVSWIGSRKLLDTAFQMASPLAPEIFRYGHCEVHHRFENRPQDWTGPFSYKNTSYPERPVSLRRYIVTFTGRAWKEGIKAALNGNIAQRAALEATVILLGWSVCLAVLTLYRWPEVIFFYLLPYASIWFGAPIANWLQHHGASYQDSMTTAVNNLRFTSRTAGLNIGYHAAHHAAPSAHWSDLPAIHQQLVERTAFEPLSRK